MTVCCLSLMEFLVHTLLCDIASKKRYTFNDIRNEVLKITNKLLQEDNFDIKDNGGFDNTFDPMMGINDSVDLMADDGTKSLDRNEEHISLHEKCDEDKKLGKTIAGLSKVTHKKKTSSKLNVNFEGRTNGLVCFIKSSKGNVVDVPVRLVMMF
ncbi:hypothetical protein VNO78_19899 [Psophocarpus tetragonolobus]|uniref:Uncharacterized protein n=1 Tax=Psophocarpus tetragonolobus TaxID=3891 RepID=A0AAN9S8G3_PSOTE